MQPMAKAVLAIVPVSKTAGATASGTVDTRGFSFCTIDVLGSATGDTTAPTVLKVEQSHDLTTYASCSLTGGTDFTIPIGNTSGSVIAKFNMDLRGKRRYLKVTFSPGTTTIVGAVANLFKGGNNPAPLATTGANVDVIANV
jgi:hypothetical protein